MMRKVNTWALAILFGSILAYGGWNGLELLNVFTGDTNIVSGKIIDVFPSQDVKTFSRRVKYVYSVNNKYYVDFKKLGTRDKKQAIGNNIRIVYSIKNPQKNRVEELLNDYSNSKGVKFYSSIDNGFLEMHLINGIFKYQEIGSKGKVINDFVGEYKFSGDTLRFQHYIFETDESKTKRSELFVFGTDNTDHLIEKETKQKFIKIRYSR